MKTVCEGGVWDILLSEKEAKEYVDIKLSAIEKVLDEKLDCAIKTLIKTMAKFEHKIDNLEKTVQQLKD